MEELEGVLNSMKTGKSRDPEGVVRDIFKIDVIGENLKVSLLMMMNKIKETGLMPECMNVVNIASIYKGKGERTDLESERGIFLVTTLRMILMKLVYARKYPIIDSSMSDSNIGARKNKNIRNHIFVVNSILHDVLSKKSKDPVDIMVLDFKQMFDSECLFECLNDVYEAGVDDDVFPLLYEANKKAFVAVQTPGGLTERVLIPEIVMQGDVLAPLMSSLQVDTIGKECIEEGKHLYFYKNIVPIPPLGLVDDLFTISTCGYKTNLLNKFINKKSAEKKLQFGASKCVKIHVGKTCNKSMCTDLSVGEWKVKVVNDPKTKLDYRKETFCGLVKMEEKKDQLYLGDVISVDGKHDKNIERRKAKSYGIINQIMDILTSNFFGKYHFEVALILRSSLLLSSLLLNSEAWVNLTSQNIRKLEQIDEMLLTKILDSETCTSNAMKYLELGVVPLRFEIMKRKLMFLQYILKQEKKCMIYRVLSATVENPSKNDFVDTCNKYLKDLDVKMTFEEIGKMSQKHFKKIICENVKKLSFEYLIKQKCEQSKAKNVQYDKLEMQEYFVGGNCSREVAKLIFKSRSMSLDIKMNKRWKYADVLCVGCSEKEETMDELMLCKVLNYDNSVSKKPAKFKDFFSGNVKDLVKAGMEVQKSWKKRKGILEM